MNVAIFGSRYVGLATRAYVAEGGNHGVCMDVDEGKIDRLNNLEISIYEPDFTDLVE